MEDKYVNVVLTGDQNYVIPMGVTMYSVVPNLPYGRTALFFLIVSGWGQQEEREIHKLRNCEIIILPAEGHLHYFSQEDVRKYKLDYMESLAPYYRLLIPKILPEDVETAFYMDADMICDTDISGIYDAMPHDKLIGAVAELVANAQRKNVLKYLEGWKEFSAFNNNYDRAPYFNAGFLLINLKLARKLNIFDDFLDFLGAHPNPPYADQGTLNAICGQKYRDKMPYLPPEWNVLYLSQSFI